MVHDADVEMVDDDQSDSSSDSEGCENVIHTILQLVQLTCCILQKHILTWKDDATFEETLGQLSIDAESDVNTGLLGSGLFVVETVTTKGERAYYGLISSESDDPHGFVYLPVECQFHLIGNKSATITKSKCGELLDFIEACAQECLALKEGTATPYESLNTTLNLPLCISTYVQYNRLFDKLLSGISMPELVYEQQENIPTYKNKLTGHTFDIQFIPKGCKYFDTVERIVEAMQASKDKKCVLLECPTRFMAPPLARKLVKMLREATTQCDELQIILTDIPDNMKQYCNWYNI